MIAMLPILAAVLLGATGNMRPVCPSGSHRAAADPVTAPRTPADTARSVRSPGERAPAARKRKPLKRSGTVVAPGESTRPLDDQIWNSEFFVRNTAPAASRPAPSVWLVSARPR